MRLLESFRQVGAGYGVVCVFVICLAATAAADWCRTTEKYYEVNGSRLSKNTAACPFEGQCDDPATRNSFIPVSGDSVVHLHIMFHIFRNDDGSNPTSDEATVLSQMAELNRDYAPSRIHFSFDWRFVDDSRYVSLAEDEFFPMKQQYAIAPDRQLNVFVGYVEESYSYGTFPWDPDCLTAQGGIVMTTPHFFRSNSVLAHEVGHCLGLWHTFHGVSEVAFCGPCYERVEGPERDVTGDMCSDTRSTPLNNYCLEVTSTDGCSGLPFAPTDRDNFMSYSSDPCWAKFTPQQGGRMHCWLDDVLSSWKCGGTPDTDGDLVSDLCDNCLVTVNGDQLDSDNDYIGDVCDDCIDRDFDGVGDPEVASTGCASDDNCPDIANSDQLDTDADSYGDACDNCPGVFNPEQRDKNADGVGDLCDGNLHIVTYDLPDGFMGKPYSAQLESINGVQPVNWVLFGGDLPFGCDFTGGAIGTISGTPTYKATFYMTFVVEDAGDPRQADTLSLSINILDPPFICGDVDGSKQVNFSDAVFIVNYIFAAGAAPSQFESADVNCDLRLDISDAVFLLNYFFNFGASPCSACP